MKTLAHCDALKKSWFLQIHGGHRILRQACRLYPQKKCHLFPQPPHSGLLSHPKKDLNKQNQANNLPASTSWNNGSPVRTSPRVVSPPFVEVVASVKENKERNKVCDLGKYRM